MNIRSTDNYNDAIAQKFWERAATEFANRKPENLGWRYAVKPFLERICANARLGHVLDAGCGIGDLIGVANLSSSNYLGVDWSRNLIDFARVNNPNYEFRVGNIYYPSEDMVGAFDSVFSINVVQDCEWLPHSAASMYACTKPGGRAFIIIENPYWTAYSISNSQNSAKLAVNSFDIIYSTFISKEHPIIGWHRPLNYYRKVFQSVGYEQVWSGVEIETLPPDQVDPVARALFEKNGMFNTSVFSYFELLKPERDRERNRVFGGYSFNVGD